jgi:hypothetical protein
MGHDGHLKPPRCVRNGSGCVGNTDCNRVATDPFAFAEVTDRDTGRNHSRQSLLGFHDPIRAEIIQPKIVARCRYYDRAAGPGPDQAIDRIPKLCATLTATVRCSPRA